ncbi:MAG: type IX secretion system sortase PorU [Ignavibacteria bacterium]|nr:type IX secretion system sortase PorU [Ignavibacteria bacterium]
MPRRKYFLFLVFFLILYFQIRPQSLFTRSIEIIEETESTLKIVCKPYIIKIDTINIDDIHFLRPNFSESTFELGNLSEPTTFAIRKLLSVPDSTSFKLTSVVVKKFKIIEGKILPRCNPSLPCSYLEQIYASKRIEQWVNLSYAGIGRYLHIAYLDIILAQQDVRNNQILVPEEIEIEISFERKNTSNFSEFVERDLFQKVLNSKQAEKWIVNFARTGLAKKTPETPLSTPRTVVKIKIEKEGIYRIDAGMLASIGVNISPQEVTTIKLYGREGKPLDEDVSSSKNNAWIEIPIIVQTKENSELDHILFYGTGTQGFEYSKEEFRNFNNPYSNFNYYFLTWGGSPGSRIQPSENVICTRYEIPKFYIERILYREEIINPFNSGSGRTWFGNSIFPKTFVNQLPDLYRDEKILYRFYVAHNFASSNNANGSFVFYEGANKIADTTLPPCYSYDEATAIVVPKTISSNIISSDNRSYLKIEYKNPLISQAIPYFNWYEIHYPRSFVAIDNNIIFFTDPIDTNCTEYHISGFTGSILGLEVSNPLKPTRLQNISPVANTFIFRTKHILGSPKKFAVSSKFFKPEISKIELTNLRENELNSEIVVITHRSLLNSATKYKEYREQTTKFKVAVVTTEDIFNEFSFGIPDPTAIRDFLSYAFENWEIKPRYVLLWGDGHYDYRNISTKNTNFIPAYQDGENTFVYNSTRSFTTDDFFACIVGNDRIIDLSIGRIPIYDDATGMLYLDKIKRYENRSLKTDWRIRLLFAADDSQTSSPNHPDGNQHTRDSEAIANSSVPKHFDITKLYLAEFPTENVVGGRRKPLATADLIQKINKGVLLVNWLGHGNPRVWAHEELFDRDKTISLLTNIDNLFFGIAGTCDFGRFDMTEIKSGTEELIFYPKGGAVGFFTATRAVYVSGNYYITREFISELFQRDRDGKYPRLGDVYFQVKQNKFTENDQKYVLFCDPLLSLNIPENVVKFNVVNGINVESLPPDSNIKIKALSELNLGGCIYEPNGGKVLNNFNGTIEIVIHDVEYTKVVKDIDQTIHLIKKEGGIIAKGTFPVENGCFSAKFYITDELSYLKGNIIIRTFAKDTLNNLFAKGSERRLVVAGIDTTLSIFDNEPPIIKLYINDTSFAEGDIVSNPPTLIVRLYDNTAINSTGAGIGHLIEAWIDDNPNSIDLTDKYESSPFNPREGFAKATLYNLQPGLHTVKVRAWDIFNNYSIATTKFRILDPADGIKLYNSQVRPNPIVSNSAVFRVQHNANPPFTIKLEIFNSFGELLFSNSYDMFTPLTSTINWNCIDNNNNQLPTGVYLYKITIESQNKINWITDKFAIIR